MKDLKEDKHINNFSKLKTAIKNGFNNGLKTSYILVKIIVPVYIFVTILKYTGILEWISTALSPLMNIFGLPGEAALVLVLGNFVNIYAAIGAVTSITLLPKQITIIAMMLSFSHSLFVETAVAKKTGVNVIIVLFIRISLAIMSGILLNLIL